MKLLTTWFLPAMALSSASAAASVVAAGSCMPWLRAMLRGTMLSISARREASPMTDSMWASSASLTPMWRAMNSLGFSSSPRGLTAGISMACLKGDVDQRFLKRCGAKRREGDMNCSDVKCLVPEIAWNRLCRATGIAPLRGSRAARQGWSLSPCSEGVVGGLVEQRVHLRRIGEPDLEEPAGSQWIAVGQRRVGTQGFIDFGHFATDRHVHVGRGLHRLDHAGHVF